MPAGVSWVQYGKFFVAAFAVMMAGSQAVHIYYKPLSDIELYVEQERAKSLSRKDTDMKS